jgi:GNAT superfamily N-acetyltransferase
VNRSMELIFRTRPYEDGDEEEVLSLLRASLGAGPTGERSAAFFRWKHMENPFGRSFMLVAEADDRLIGFRALMRWEFTAGGRTYRAIRPVDTATHPAYQGRGVFSKLTQDALRQLSGQVDFIFNTPNRKSLPGYRKLGWETVGGVSVVIRVRHPIRFARRVRREDATIDGVPPAVTAESAAEALDELGQELVNLDEPSDDRLRTPRSVAFLQWRYGAPPGLDYRLVREEQGTQLRGLLIFRVRPRGGLWESTISDLIVIDGDRRTARRLLRRAARVSRVDHLICSFSPGTAAGRAAKPVAGFLRAPKGMTLVINPRRPNLVPDPRMLASWALCLGDLEVF